MKRGEMNPRGARVRNKSLRLITVIGLHLRALTFQEWIVFSQVETRVAINPLIYPGRQITRRNVKFILNRA